MAAPDERRSRKFVTAFARGLAVIEAFGPEARRMSVADVAARTGLDRAVTRRLLLTLAELGFVTVEGKQFELTPRILRLGYSYLAAIGLDRILQPYLDELSRAIAETVSVSVLDADEVVFVARSDIGGRRMSYNVTTGMRLPAFASASGRVLLSTLPDAQVAGVLQKSNVRAHTPHTVTDRKELLRIVQKVRRDGYAINEQETEEGLLGASVLLRSRSGRAVASLNCSSHVSRMKKNMLVRDLIPRLQEFAGRISGVLL